MLQAFPWTPWSWLAEHYADKISQPTLVIYGTDASTAICSTAFIEKLTNDHEVLAHAAGKMRKHRIRVLQGDNVLVEMTPYDLTKGRINYRFK